MVASASASAALTVLEHANPHLVLLDCLLPGGGTVEVLGRADRAGVPVILMSGDLERMEALSDGARPFLSKPFSIDSLMRAVAAALPHQV